MITSSQSHPKTIQTHLNMIPQTSTFDIDCSTMDSKATIMYSTKINPMFTARPMTKSVMTRTIETRLKCRRAEQAYRVQELCNEKPNQT